MTSSNIATYFKALRLLALLGFILALVAIIVLVIHTPTLHPTLKLIAIAIFELIILILAMKHKVSAFVLAFLLNLYELIYAYHMGIVYDIFNFHASILSYLTFALVILMLIVSSLGLLACFKNRKLTNM